MFTEQEISGMREAYIGSRGWSVFEDQQGNTCRTYRTDRGIDIYNKVGSMTVKVSLTKSQLNGIIE